MRLVKLKDIELLYSNVSEDLYSEWDSSSTYNTGDRVYVTKESDGTTERTPHEIYESLADNNTGNYPPDHPDKWGLISATNRWKMFDQYVNTQTENDTTIEVVVKFPLCDTFALFNVDAIEVDWYLYKDDYTNPDNLVTSGTIDLTESVPNWYEYFYSEIEYKNDVYVNGIPIYGTGQLKVVLKKSSGIVKCGMLCIGRERFLGLTQFDVSVSILDYSRKEVDDYGNIYLKQGRYAKKVECDFWLDTGQIDYVRRALADVRAMPAVYNINNVNLQDNIFTSLIVYGFYKNFDIIISGTKYSKCTLEIEGIV